VGNLKDCFVLMRGREDVVEESCRGQSIGKVNV
jgi:hypothetical protein